MTVASGRGEYSISFFVDHVLCVLFIFQIIYRSIYRIDPHVLSFCFFGLVRRDGGILSEKKQTTKTVV